MLDGNAIAAGNVTGLSVVIPAYNESRSIADVLRTVLKYGEEHFAPFEVVAVDDGSSDDTLSGLRACREQRPDCVNVLTHDGNRGLTAAILTGARAAKYPQIAFLDADLSYAPSVLERLVAAKRDSGAVVAIASPYMPGGRAENVPPLRLVASRGANWLLSSVTGCGIRTFTGMVRVYDRSTFLEEAESAATRGEFNAAMLAALMRRGSTIAEVAATLCWPPERVAATPRLGARALARRARLVVDSIACFLAPGRPRMRTIRQGPMVLIHRPKRP